MGAESTHSEGPLHTVRHLAPRLSRLPQNPPGRTPLSLPPHFQPISTSCDSIFSHLYSHSIQATGPLSQPPQRLPIGLPVSASVSPTVCPQYSPKPNQVAPAHSEQSPQPFPHLTRCFPTLFHTPLQPPSPCSSWLAKRVSPGLVLPHSPLC